MSWLFVKRIKKKNNQINFEAKISLRFSPNNGSLLATKEEKEEDEAEIRDDSNELTEAVLKREKGNEEKGSKFNLYNQIKLKEKIS